MNEKKFTREDFKEDVREAVRTAKVKKVMKVMKKKSTRGRKGVYSGMSTTELRKLVAEKKLKILTKFGFPNGTNPKDREGMIALCKKLKRRKL